MAITKAKPTSPGRRFRSVSSNPELFKGRSYQPLTEPKLNSGGRNNSGKITIEYKDLDQFEFLSDLLTKN